MFKLLTLIPTTLVKLLTKNLIITLAVLLLLIGIYTFSQYQSTGNLKSQLITTKSLADSNKEKLASVSAELEKLKNQDQVKRNNDLQAEIKNIQDTYKKGLKSYENLVDLKTSPNISKVDSKELAELDKTLAVSLQKLSDRNYNDGSTSLDDLNKKIQGVKDKITPTPPPAPVGPTVDTNAPTTTTPPDSGYQRINVTAGETYPVDIISADLSSSKVIVDTASDSDCGNNCPVMPLGNYASRSGAFAAINGPFFCPSTYPSCAGRANSFDTLLMNKNKHYFNSGNNVYSNIPAAIFSTSARFVGRSLEWGRDTGPDSVIANYPLLVQGGSVVFGGGGDAKFGAKGARCFIANKGNKVYIGVVYNATMSDSANVMKSLSMDNALNLDEGGSTALWYNGRYLAGPGRDLPFGILLVRR